MGLVGGGFCGVLCLGWGWGGGGVGVAVLACGLGGGCGGGGGGEVGGGWWVGIIIDKTNTVVRK